MKLSFSLNKQERTIDSLLSKKNINYVCIKIHTNHSGYLSLSKSKYFLMISYLTTTTTK